MDNTKDNTFAHSIPDSVLFSAEISRKNNEFMCRKLCSAGCCNSLCLFDPHHRHPKQPGIERFRAAFLFSENAAPQPPGHPVLPRGRLELDLLFQRPVCRRRRHRALAVAGAAAALNIFCQKALTTANAHDRITDDFERRRRTGSFQSNFPMDRPAGLRPYGQPGPLPTGGASRHY